MKSTIKIISKELNNLVNYISKLITNTIKFIINIIKTCINIITSSIYYVLIIFLILSGFFIFKEIYNNTSNKSFVEVGVEKTKQILNVVKDESKTLKSTGISHIAKVPSRVYNGMSSGDEVNNSFLRDVNSGISTINRIAKAGAELIDDSRKILTNMSTN